MDEDSESLDVARLDSKDGTPNKRREKEDKEEPKNDSGDSGDSEELNKESILSGLGGEEYEFSENKDNSSSSEKENEKGSLNECEENQESQSPISKKLGEILREQEQKKKEVKQIPDFYGDWDSKAMNLQEGSEKLPNRSQNDKIDYERTPKPGDTIISLRRDLKFSMEMDESQSKNNDEGDHDEKPKENQKVDRKSGQEAEKENEKANEGEGINGNESKETPKARIDDATLTKKEIVVEWDKMSPAHSESKQEETKKEKEEENSKDKRRKDQNAHEAQKYSGPIKVFTLGDLKKMKEQEAKKTKKKKKVPENRTESIDRFLEDREKPSRVKNHPLYQGRSVANDHSGNRPQSAGTSDRYSSVPSDVVVNPKDQSIDPLRDQDPHNRHDGSDEVISMSSSYKRPLTGEKKLKKKKKAKKLNESSEIPRKPGFNEYLNEMKLEANDENSGPSSQNFPISISDVKKTRSNFLKFKIKGF